MSQVERRKPIEVLAPETERRGVNDPKPTPAKGAASSMPMPVKWSRDALRKAVRVKVAATNQRLAERLNDITARADRLAFKAR